MDLYIGDAAAVALQKKVDRLSDWIAATPGAAQGGRIMTTEDADRLGWETIGRHIEEDGMFAFRMIPRAEYGTIADRITALGMHLHSWDVFLATEEDLSVRRAPFLPAAALEVELHETVPRNVVEEVMNLLIAAGLKPFSARILSGAAGPSSLVTARNRNDGRLVAAAFGHFPSNSHSRWHHTAWCGLVAVESASRGQGAGRLVNDAVADAMVSRHGAEAVVEFAAADNNASRRMIEGTGLRRQPDLITAAASTATVPYSR